MSAQQQPLARNYVHTVYNQDKFSLRWNKENRMFSIRICSCFVVRLSHLLQKFFWIEHWRIKRKSYIVGFWVNFLFILVLPWHHSKGYRATSQGVASQRHRKQLLYISSFRSQNRHFYYSWNIFDLKLLLCRWGQVRKDFFVCCCQAVRIFIYVLLSSVCFGWEWY